MRWACGSGFSRIRQHDISGFPAVSLDHRPPGQSPSDLEIGRWQDRAQHGGVSWENRDDGPPEFFPQIDRRLYFYDLPEECLIRIFTLSGDLVIIIPHNVDGDFGSGWDAPFAEMWDLNSRNLQQVVSGTYLFSVENMTAEKKGDIEVGKFVIIR